MSVATPSWVTLVSAQNAAINARRDAAQAAKFERILDLEAAFRASKALGGMIVGNSTAVIKADQDRLFAALDALTPTERVAFGTYRASRV